MLYKAFLKSRKGLLIPVLIFFIACVGLNGTAFSLDGAGADNPIKVLLNGEKLEFDVDPYIKDGRTLVPFRKIFEAFGLEVQWNATDQTVLAKNDNTEISLKINDTKAYVNRYLKDLDVAPEITGSRTFVPLRFIGESIGADVLWDGNTRTVTITYSTGVYKTGETAAYGDLKFSIDSVDLDLEEHTVKVDGKISSEFKKMFVYFYESPLKYVVASAFITDNNDNMFNFEAISTFSSSLDFKNISYIELKLFNQDNKPVKIAQFVL